LAQSVREAARTQEIMAGRIADELREVYRNLDLRPQIIPVPMPQIVVPQPTGTPAWGGVPPGLEIAGIPRYAREEELPLEPEAGAEKEEWEEAFTGLEPFPEELAGEEPEERRKGPPDRRTGKAERREATVERRQGPPDRREESAERRKLKDYLAKVREKLEGPPTSPGFAPAAPADKPAVAAPPAGKPAAQPPTSATPSIEGPLALLEELGEYLPKREPERRKSSAFMRSDARMKLDYLKSRLEGHKGIMQKIQDSYGPAPAPVEGSVSLQKVADAFIFIKELAGHYPDPSVGTMMQSKVDSILRRIKR
jgi:hypothetical protein